MSLEETRNFMEHNYSALLMDYAAGTLDEAQSMIVAAHLTLSPESRVVVSECESWGGAMLQDCECEALSGDALSSVLDRLDTVSGHETPALSYCDTLTDMKLPRPLQAYIKDKDQLAWKIVYPGIKSYDLSVPCTKSSARLLKIDPATKTPHHSHKGTEITLMLDGSAHDEAGQYTRGDLIVMDDRVTHQPIADEVEGCLCLVVNTDAIRLTGWMGKLLNPFLRP